MGNANWKVKFKVSMYMYLLWSLHNFIILFLVIARLLNSAS